MILAAAVGLGVAAAVTYGIAAAVQHDAIQHAGGTAGESDGEAGGDTRGAALHDLLRDSRWWTSIGGDTIGLILQLSALILGPVVVVQPLFVLCLPVALPLRARYGGPRPGRRDYLDCVVLVVGLVGFFALIGKPSASRELTVATAGSLAVITLAVGVAIALAVRTAPGIVKAVALSSVTGIWFGVEAVLINAASASWSKEGGFAALGHANGLVSTVGALVVGTSGFVMSQLAFRAGHLGASFPAMLVVDPVLAVILGAVLLGEHGRSGPAIYVGYAVCAAVIVAATFRLASPPTPVPVEVGV